jgi:hypothetical protein
MLLSLLRRYNIKTIYIAGFDGFQKNAVNFYDTSFERKIRNDDYETGIRKRIISEVYSDMHISFLTRSIYES